MIKGIIFDWFGVCTTENWGDCVCRELMQKTKASESKIRTEYKALLQDFMKCKLSPKQFFEKLISSIDPKLNPNDFHYLLNVIPDLNIELLDLIKKLKTRHNIYLLSNNIPELFEQYAKKINFKDYFDITFLSHELKINKTDDKIWQVVLSKIKHKPEELIFIDNKDKYLEFAKAHNVNTILFKNNSQLKKDLETYNINLK